MFKIIKIVFLSLMFVANAYAAVYTNWNTGDGEPNDPDSFWNITQDCAAIRSDGEWFDENCFWNSKPFACYDGVNWGISLASQNLGGEPTAGNPQTQCQALGSKFYFAAPFNAYENERLKQTLLSQDKGEAWININDINSEGSHESNTGFRNAVQPPYITRWKGDDLSNLDEPDGKEEDCGSMDYNGYWYDEPCDVDVAEEKRYLCADHGVNWFISAAKGGDGRLYAAEKACRSDSSTDTVMYDSTFSLPSSDVQNESIRNTIRGNSNGSLQPGEKIWINFNDRLVEGEYKFDENRFFWDEGEPNSASENCVVRNGSDKNRGWNDVNCTANKSYACYRHSTDTWQAVSVSGSTKFNLEEGVKACQDYDNFSNQYTFWAPKDVKQNESGVDGDSNNNGNNDDGHNGSSINGSWLNIQWDTPSADWQVNRDATHWGSTIVNDKDGDGYNTNFRTIPEPNNGVFPSHVVEVPALNGSDNEDCASQQGNGSWYDLPCLSAMKFACYDSANNDWRLAPASVNATVYSGENACQSLTKNHEYHFAAPGTRQQQTDLALEADKVAVWVNATDRTEEKKWRYNQFLTFWAGEGVDVIANPEQPEKDESKDCAIAKGSDSALWYARSCTESHQYLCNNAGSWNLVTANTIDGASEQSGQEACNSNGLFLAPSTLSEQQAVSALIEAKDVWINASDVQIEEAWKINELQFWDANEPASSGDCAVMQKTADVHNGLWVSNDCGAESQPFLCFDTEYGGWKESDDSDTMEHFANGQNACEAMNGFVGGEYHAFEFAAPIYTWENDAAKNAISENVWINGNDRITSDLWVFNEFLYWTGSALNPSTTAVNDCLVINNSGHWQDIACDTTDTYKVACYSGDGWYLSATSINISNFTDAQRACSAIGNGYRFFSPVTVADNRDLRALIGEVSVGVSELVWINGIDIAEEGKWVFNSTGLPTPNWASTEPHGKTLENCAYVDSNGLWYDDVCSGPTSVSKKLVCKKPDGSLGISVNSLELISNFDNAQAECQSFGVGATFYAPTTFNENEELRQLLSAGEKVWVNASDNYIEARWALNVASITDYDAITPNTVAIDGCAYFDDQGTTIAASCSAQSRAVVCSNGQEWKVSNNKVLLGTDPDNGTLIRNAFAVCQQEFSGEYTFAVPSNTDDAAKWELSQALALSGKASAWLNMADWFVKTQFSSNMPYQNIAVTDPAQAVTGCAYTDGTGDGWLIAQQCDSIAAHFACFNGSVWKVAPANGTIDEPAIPQDIIDAWDQSYGDLRCREYFGQSYNFSSPITPKEDADLKQVVSRLDNTYKKTWINYYSNRLWAGLNGQQWFADRINLSVVDNVKLDQGATTEDCASITRESDKLNLEDEVCSSVKNALCFDGTNWSKTTTPVQWNKASARCGLELGEEHVFAIPRDSLERSQVIGNDDNNSANDLLSEGETLWVNYSDLSVENKWRANIPVRQWWADAEPTNRGNRDCVVMGGVGSGMTPGEWRSDYCDQVFHQYACKRGTAWQVIGLDGLASSAGGIWAQGFSACRKIPDDSNGPWHFDFPEDYFANLATATTIAAGPGNPQGFDNGDVVLKNALENTTAWLNLTDQYREKDWQRGRQFSDWAASFAFDDNKDCAFVDTEVTEINNQSVQGTWQPGLCFASDKSRQYACTNGLNWAIADAVGPATGNNWLDGFSACEALTGDWTFAAPVTIFDNERLKAAIGKGSAWINLQDVSSDGDWAANLSKPNLPPIIKFLDEDKDNEINETTVAEQSTGNNINLQVIDPEGLGDLDVVITQVSTGAVITSPTSQTDVRDFSFIYSAPTASNTVKALTFKLVATDFDGLTTTTFFKADVIPAIIAWYDFNDANKPNFDKTGNENHANDNPELPYDFPPVKNGAIDISSGSEKMTVDGVKLAMPADYAIALRIWADGDDEAEHPHFQIKYEATNQCFDLSGVGDAAATVGKAVQMSTCENESDHYWYYDDNTRLIHSVANSALCLSYPDDANIKLSYCSNVQHSWIINSDKSIASELIPGSYLHAASSSNGAAVVLSTTKSLWETEKTFGRGILQKGSAANQPLLTFGNKVSNLTYTVGENTATTAQPLKVEQWVNVVVNVVGDQLSLFVDGIKDANSPVTLNANAVANNENLIIGDIPSALRSFIGRVDDVQVFSRPLSDVEVIEILPEPPVGLVQFENASIVRQEPQVEGVSLNNPVIVLRTDGSNGQLRAWYKTHEKTANENEDYVGLDGTLNELIWKPTDEPLYLTPEYDLLPLLSSLPAVSIDSVELDRTQPIFVAIDLTIPATPLGVLWEQGGSGRGAFIGFNEANELVVRAGYGGALPSNETARFVDSGANLDNKTGTLFVEIDPTAAKHSVRAWFKEGGLFGEAAILYLGGNTSVSPFPSNEWQGGDAGMLGDDTGSFVVGEYPAAAPAYNDTITLARFYNQLAPDPIERIVENAKLAKVTLSNENPFDREPTERFDLALINTDRRATDLDTWTSFPEGVTGDLNQTEVSLLDYTKNPYGILQFSRSSYECSEPYADDNDGKADYSSENRFYRDCSVEVQRRTGGLGNISVQYGISARGMTHTFGTVTPSTDVLFSSSNLKLTFAPGVRTQNINFRVIAEIGTNNRYENNEEFTLTLFNPLNEDGDDSPWLGDPIAATVVMKDYSVGVVDVEKEQAYISEPLQSELVSHIKSIFIRRSEGSDGIANFEVSIPTTGQIAERGVDYDLLNVDMSVASGAVALTWEDGQQSSLPVFIKIYSDKYQEVEPFVVTGAGNEANNCFDGSGDGLPDNLDRDCSNGESFILNLTELSSSDVPIHATRTSTTVYIRDNTAPAVIGFTTTTKDYTTISEEMTSNTVDANNDGIYVEGVEAVADTSVKIEIERSNRNAEHAVWLYVRGVANVSSIAANFIGDTSSPGTRVRGVHDAWFESPLIRDGKVADEYKYLWVLPRVVEGSIPSNSDLTVTTTVDEWHQGDTASNIAAMTDGVLNSPYQVHPVNSLGESVNFSWANNYQGGRVVFHNRNDGCCKTRIAGSRMDFFLDAVSVHQFDFTAANSDTDTINIPIPAGVVFDQMRLVFPLTGETSQNFREIEVFSTPSEELTYKHSIDINIYDNEIENSDKRNLEFRLEEASIRDAKVIVFGTAGSNSTAEFADIEITDHNIDPEWGSIAPSAAHVYNMPIRDGGSMKLDSRVQFGTNVSAGNRIKAYDPDWVTMNYQVAVDSGAYKSANRTSTGGYLSWDRGMVDTWDFTTPGTKTLDSYSFPINIKASDSEGIELSTSANITLNLAWRKIRLANSDECIFKTGSTIEWDYWISNNCANNDNYYWAAIPVDGVNSAYQLINKSSMTCLYKNDGPDGGAGFRTCQGGPEEYWYFDRNGAGSETIQRWDDTEGEWEYLCGNVGDGIDIKVGGSCSWSNARWK